MKFLKKIKIATLFSFIYLMGIISAQATAKDCECGEPENIWFRLTTENGVQRLVGLDMNRGQSWADPQYIYILIKDVSTEEGVVIIFPNGGDWVAETKQDPFYNALEKEFKDLEEYLKYNQGKGTEIKKKQ
tara:strand:- start:61 stop:453 length:393 start_codon:yes stop_codon:yes gene_type:complete